MGGLFIETGPLPARTPALKRRSRETKELFRTTVTTSVQSTGGAEIATASKYGFHLHAKPYVGLSGSSDFIGFEAVISRLVVYSEFLFSALGQNFFDLCTDTVNP